MKQEGLQEKMHVWALEAVMCSSDLSLIQRSNRAFYQASAYPCLRHHRPLLPLLPRHHHHLPLPHPIHFEYEI